MSIAIAVFVKTPHLTPAKTRLAQSIGKEAALSVYEQCLTRTTECLKSAQKMSPDLAVYWAVSESEATNLPRWSSFPTIWQGEGDLGQRLHHVYDQLIQDHDAVILIGSDAPDLSAEILYNAQICLLQVDCVIGPATDGGFYLFGCQHTIESSTWTSVSYSQSDTLAQLESKLEDRSFSMNYLPELQDIDTHDDWLRYQASQNAE